MLEAITMLYTGAMTVKPKIWTWDPFHERFSIVIQIRWKIVIGVTPLFGIITLQNFTHATTAQLSYHVQNLLTIFINWGESRIKYPFNLNYDGKIFREMGPRNQLLLCNDNSYHWFVWWSATCSASLFYSNQCNEPFSTNVIWTWIETKQMSWYLHTNIDLGIIKALVQLYYNISKETKQTYEMPALMYTTVKTVRHINILLPLCVNYWKPSLWPWRGYKLLQI